MDALRGPFSRRGRDQGFAKRALSLSLGAEAGRGSLKTLERGRLHDLRMQIAVSPRARTARRMTRKQEDPLAANLHNRFVKRWPGLIVGGGHAERNRWRRDRFLPENVGYR